MSRLYNLWELIKMDYVIEYESEDREEREYCEGEEYWKDEGVEVEVY